MNNNKGKIAIVAGLIFAPMAPLFIFLLLLGGSPNCGDDGSTGNVGTLSAAATKAIPANVLPMYEAAAKRWNIDIAFLAAIGEQETDHGRNPAAQVVNYAGCIGVMQLGVGGACGNFWGAYKCDGNHDGKMSVLDPWDNICAAAHGLREGKGAPPAGGSYEGYYRAACGYFGACTIPGVAYAPEVMATAVSYGFKGGHVTDASAIPVADASGGTAASSEQCSGGVQAVGNANIGKVVKHTEPRKMMDLPAWATAKGYNSPAIFSGHARADARIVPAILWILQHYNLRVHDCLASGHNTHGTGDSCDIVPEEDPLPRPGANEAKWVNVTKFANDFGWHQPGPGYAGGYACNSGYPFKGGIYIICYNGDVNHGDPAHEYGGCACPHIHITFTSPQIGAPVALALPPAWVETFDVSTSTTTDTSDNGGAHTSGGGSSGDASSGTTPHRKRSTAKSRST